MTDKRKLLDQLQIYRSPSEGSGGGAWTGTVRIAAVAAVLGAGGTYLFADSEDSVNARAGHRHVAVARPQSIPAPERDPRILPDMGVKVALLWIDSLATELES